MQRTKRRSYIQSLKNEIDTLKSQLCERDDVHLYYDHVMKLASAAAHSALGGSGDRDLVQPKRHYNKFINQTMQQQLVKTDYTDIKLVIKVAEEVSIEVKTHRFLLASCSTFMEALMRHEAAKQKQEPTHNQELLLTMPLDLSDSCNDPEVVRVFFRLFYVALFEDTHFTVDEIAFIITNALSLHEMALRFRYKPLMHYTKLKIYESFNMDVFPALFQYCVAYYPDTVVGRRTELVTSKRCKVLSGKEGLFKRLISWLITCANIHAYHLPYLNLLSAYDVVSNGNNEADDEDIVVENSNKQQLQSSQLRWSLNTSQDSIMKKKRRRLSTHNDRKVDIYDMMCNNVDNFERYDIVSRFIAYDDVSRSTTIRSFNRVCLQCAGNNKKHQCSCMNLCMDKKTGFTRKWQFYIKISNDNERSSTLFGKVNYFMKDNMWIESSTAQQPPDTNYFINGCLPLLQCKTSVTSLSKLYKNEEVTSGSIPIISAFTDFMPLLSFQLPPESSCYNGECDVCGAADTRIFVIRYDIIAKDA